MTPLLRVQTRDDLAQAPRHCWWRRVLSGVGAVVPVGIGLLAGACLAVFFGASYMDRRIEAGCSRVGGPAIDAVLLAHGAHQRGETLASYLDRTAPLVAKGILPPDELQKEEGWLVCPTFNAVGTGR